VRVPPSALSRRRFLGLAAGTTAALALPGCGSEPAAPAATQAERVRPHRWPSR
jgi:hypothetical protein